MQIYIRRDNEDFGPYSREAVQEYVKQGVFQETDSACYAGMDEWKTVGQLLGLNGAARPRRGEFSGGTRITEFNPSLTQGMLPAQPVDRAGRKSVMITLNVVLIIIVAIVGYIRLGGGARVLRPYLAGLSAELAKMANGGADNNAAQAPAATAPAVSGETPATVISTPAPASASNEPATAPGPVSAPASTPVPAEALVAPSASPSASMAPTPSELVAPPTAAEDQAPAPPAAPVAPAAPKPFPADLAADPAAWPRTVILKQAVAFPALFNGQVVGTISAPAGSTVSLVNIEGDQVVLNYQGGTQTIPWKLTNLQEEAAKMAPPPATTLPSLPAAETGPGAPPITALPPTGN